MTRQLQRIYGLDPAIGQAYLNCAADPDFAEA